jgi:pyruvate dehydrogenase E2 component (dihydrolipoamide acetyltransferase)
MAIHSWREPNSSATYGAIDLDARKAIDYCNRLSAATGQKITMTHFFGKAVAEALHRHPETNVLLRFGRVYQRETADIFFQVDNHTGSRDLSGQTIENAAKKSLVEISKELTSVVRKIRSNDRSHSDVKVKSIMQRTPGTLVRYMTDFMTFLMYDLNLWSPLLSVPKNPFGSVMISNIGTLGLEWGFSPLAPYAKLPLIFLVGAITERPVVVDGKIEIAPMVAVRVTSDHRMIDGAHLAKIHSVVKEAFDDPERAFGPISNETGHEPEPHRLRSNR